MVTFRSKELRVFGVKVLLNQDVTSAYFPCHSFHCKTMRAKTRGWSSQERECWGLDNLLGLTED